MAKFYYATPELVNKAIETSLQAKKEWERVPLQDRMDLFLKVSDQMANEHRATLNATTMLGQAKTVIQAEIDAAAEMIDFFRFNSFFGKELLKYQPISEQPDATLNLMRYRSLEGFVASISPFNFTAIAGNLGYTPAIMVSCRANRLQIYMTLTGVCLFANICSYFPGQRRRVEAERHRRAFQLPDLQDLP